MKPAVFFIFPIHGLVAVWLLAWSVGAAPVVPSAFDVELVDIKPDGDDIVQSSMITPFPSGNAGADRQPDEPNFFWSGSGDDPDAGMTYWITTTVYKTAVVTMTPMTPEPSIPSSSTTILATPISPTPPTGEYAGGPIWPVEAFQPRNWIKTVLRSNANESSSKFRQLAQSKLSRMYSELLSHQQFPNRTTVGQQPQTRVHVIVQNITRRAGEIDVIYALSTVSPALGGPSSQLVEPYLAVGVVRQRADVTRELCHRPVNDTRQDGLLCQSVITLAEPFIRAEDMSVAEAAQAGSQYWIVGAILGAVLVVILIIVLIYLVGRNRQKPNEQKDVAVGHSPTLPQSDKTSRISRPQLVSRASQSSSKPTAPKMIEKVSTLPDVEEDPDPLVRKSRSTSKKHRVKRHRRLRPQTAPERNVVYRSSSSLSAIVSGSASGSASSSVDRMEYKLSREEPRQPSRGARRLKQKRTSKTDVFSSPERVQVEKQKSVKSRPTSSEVDRVNPMEKPVPKPRTKTPGTSIEMETQEVTADFTDRPDTPEEEIPVQQEAEQVYMTEEFGWRPGSLITSRVSMSVFGKVASAPAPLETSGSRDGPVPVYPKRAWLSADQMESTRPSSNNVDITVPIAYESSGNEDSDSPSTATEKPQQLLQPTNKSQLRNPSLHIHSVSYPEWPSLSETDPAIELIRSIKEELKKFEPKV